MRLPFWRTLAGGLHVLLRRSAADRELNAEVQDYLERATAENIARGMTPAAALRTSVHWKNLDRPVQVVHGRVDIPWTVEDWTGLAADEQERLWRRLLDEDRSRAFDLSAPPLMRFGLCRVADDRHWFHWSQHHLLLDGWSSSIVLNDVVFTKHAVYFTESMRPAFGHRFTPNPVYGWMAGRGWLGVKTEVGFYRHGAKTKKD